MIKKNTCKDLYEQKRLKSKMNNKVIHSNKFDDIKQFQKQPKIYKVLQYYTISKDFDPKILEQTSFNEKELVSA